MTSFFCPLFPVSRFVIESVSKRLGGSGGNTDWYFRALDDVITDLVTGELIDVL